MTFEVVAEIEEQVRQLRASGRVPPGLEDELASCFEEVADECLAAEGPATGHQVRHGSGHPTAGLGVTGRMTQLHRQASTVARRRFGPLLRRFERRTVLEAARAGETASTQVHVTADHLERLTAHSPLASRALSVARPGEPTAAGTVQPRLEGPLLAWVLEQLSGDAAGEDRKARDATPLVLHAECGDGRVVAALSARGLDARGADPNRPSRADGETNIVAAGALEYLGATPSDTLDGLLLTGVVDRLRPGAARALAQLAARRLAPGGVVVVVSARPQAVTAMDPVAADLGSGRPVHPVTWCHLFARYGLTKLAVFEPDASEPDVFAVSAERAVPALLADDGRQ